ncbi:MAG: hypothetical protein ABEJ36_04070 [Candidatus Nanosalina sp.]
MKEKFLRTAAVTILVLSLASGVAAADISIDVRDTGGDDLDNFDLTVSGEDTEIHRSNLDEASLDLDEGVYDLKVSRDGYKTIQRTISVESGEDSRYVFTLSRTDLEEDETEKISITDLDAPDSVCRGTSFAATIKIRNRGSSDEVVSTTASGLGKILLGRSFVVESGGSVRYRFIFTGVKGSGNEKYKITASNSDSDSVNGSIDVVKCQIPGDPDTVTGIDMNVYPVEGGEGAVVNEVVRVKGFADGSRGSVPLNLALDGEKIAEISTQRSGYFQTYFRPEKTGKLTVTVSTSKVSNSEQLVVVPAPRMSGIEAPEKVFAGEKFKLCTNIESAITPKMVLLENGDVIESKNDRGRVCFRITAPEKGEYVYEIRALTYGESASESTEIKVMGQGPEAESFPGQVTTVETEPGIVKVSLYNTNNGTRNYTARLENLTAEWISNPEKTVTLNKGEKDTVYFYLSPKSQGDFSAVLEVESGGKIIYSDNVRVSSLDRNPVREGRTFSEVFLRLLFILL